MSNSVTNRRVYLTYRKGWIASPPARVVFADLQKDILNRLGLAVDLPGVDVVGYPTRNYGKFTATVRVSGDHYETLNLETSPASYPTEIVQFQFTSATSLEEFVRAVARVPEPEWAVRISADLMVGVADFPDNWCPIGEGDSFGTRAQALERVRAGALAGLDGSNVNVVIVDRGIDPTSLPPGSYVGGWTVTRLGQAPIQPGTASTVDATHSTMLVRNILAITPQARVYDLPLLPAGVGDVPKFLGDAQAAFQQMELTIASAQEIGTFNGGWVIVNAWATFDRRSDFPKGTPSYGEDDTHPFHGHVKNLSAHKVDLVFAAGNCGRFCPDNRCGPGDIGHGHSISGANAYVEVLTAGAVRTDGLALGYSSQGPGMVGQPSSPISAQKPDLCAPSQFFDGSGISGGTSAACAVAAGVVAALRTAASPTTVPPSQMISVLRSTAAPVAGLVQGAWDAVLGPQFGCGII